MSSLSETTTASEPRSRRVDSSGPPEDYRLSTASTSSTTSTSSSSSTPHSSQLSPSSPSSLSTSPPIPPRSPLRLRQAAKGALVAPPPPLFVLPSESLEPIAELALELSLDPDDLDMPLLHSRSLGSISALPVSASISQPRRSATPDKPLPLTPQSSMSTPSLSIGAENSDEDDATLLPPTAEAESPRTSNMTRRQYALLELLKSEQTYAQDLGFLRDLHIPLATGAYLRQGQVTGFHDRRLTMVAPHSPSSPVDPPVQANRLLSLPTPPLPLDRRRPHRVRSRPRPTPPQQCSSCKGIRP